MLEPSVHSNYVLYLVSLLTGSCFLSFSTTCRRMSPAASIRNFSDLEAGKVVMERGVVGLLKQCCVRLFVAHPDATYSTTAWNQTADSLEICISPAGIPSSPPTSGVL